jgi:hypothetical protein
MPTLAARRRLRSLVALGLALAVFGVLAPGAVHAAVYYVGTGATCGDQPNDRASLGAALLSAALTTVDDEIRLTRTLTYTNLGLALTDWHPGVAGRLTISGGWDNCDDASASGRTALTGRLGDSLLTVNTASQASSQVTLRALDLSGAEFRGLVVTQGGALTLQDVLVHDNAGGALVGAGGTLSGDAATEIADNDLAFDGGGISCSGAGAYVGFAGRLMRNTAGGGGGNLHVGPGCLAELFAGALLQGQGAFPSPDHSAAFGGAIYVNNGTLVASGGASRVVVELHDVWQDGYGGALFATGASANVVLFNTAIRDNSARIAGAAIYAENGASVTMDRVAACPFVFSCSDVRRNRLWGGTEGEAVYADDAFVRMRRTVVVENGTQAGLVSSERKLLHAGNGAEIELDGVLLWKNYAVHLLSAAGADITAQYVTAADNSYSIDGVIYDPWVAFANSGDIGLHSSLLDDTKGAVTSAGGAVTADCLLVDSATGLPPGSFFFGVPQFINRAGGDLRQVATSPGVDFCDENLVPWPGSKDGELQVRGLDLPANPNGAPGIVGGTFDVGFDEVVPAELLFVDGFETGNTSAWSAKTP